MSWSEKITGYKEEQEAQKQLKVHIEQQRALREYNDYLQRWETSLALLDKLGIKETLTQIKDEVWQEGEVVCAPHLSLEKISHKISDNDARERYNEWREKQTPHNQKFLPFHPGPEYEVLARYSLGYKPGFLYYDEGGKPYDPYGSEGSTEYTRPSFFVVPVVNLSVGVAMRNKDGKFFFDISNLLTVDLDKFESSLSKKVLIPTGSPLAKKDIEKALVEDCVRRFEYGVSYRIDRSIESTDPRILDLVLAERKVPSGFEYLVDFAQQYAKKKQAERVAKENTARPKKGWFR